MSTPRPRVKSVVPLKRLWEKVIEPVSQYTRQDSGLDYSLDFFYQIQKMIESGYQIRLNIPPTLTGAHDNFLQTVFSQKGDEIGQVKLIPSYSKTKFQAQVQKSIKQSIENIKNPAITSVFSGENDEVVNNRSFLLPFVVMKQKFLHDQVYLNFNSILNSYQYKRMSTIDSNQLVQSYIFTKNMKASLIRFFFTPTSPKSRAYMLSNHLSFLSTKKSKQSKQLWKVQQKTEQSCDIIKIMYENKSFYRQTLHLVQCIQMFFRKKVTGVVTDWVVDARGRYYLVDVKEVGLGDMGRRFRISKSLTELLSTVTCSMCLQTCNQSQISKILTNKLIINFYQHLKRRGISLSFRINFKKISNFSRVCDLCYSLVVAQTKLIETQKKMSQICNFKTKIYGNTISTTLAVQQDEKRAQRMYQWRLFFYLEDIKDLFGVFCGDVDCGTRIYISLEVNNSVTCFQIKEPLENCMGIRIIKIQHMFSETLDINKFLRESQIRVQLSTKPKSPKPLAQGCIHGVYDQHPHPYPTPTPSPNPQQTPQQTFLQRKYKQILLFNQNSKYCVLGLYVGFCNDGLKDVRELQLKESLGVYKPQNFILNCLCLPAEWMEIVYQNYRQSMEKLMKDDSMLDTEEDNKENQQQSIGQSKNGQRLRSLTQKSTSSNRSSRILPKISQVRNQVKEKRPRLVL